MAVHIGFPFQSWESVVSRMEASSSFRSEVLQVVGRHAGKEEANFPRHSFHLHELSGFEVEREYRFYRTAQFTQEFHHTPQELG